MILSKRVGPAAIFMATDPGRNLCWKAFLFEGLHAGHMGHLVAFGADVGEVGLGE